MQYDADCLSASFNVANNFPLNLFPETAASGKSYRTKEISASKAFDLFVTPPTKIAEFFFYKRDLPFCHAAEASHFRDLNMV